MEVTKIAVLYEDTHAVTDAHCTSIKEIVPGSEVVRFRGAEEFVENVDDADILLTWGALTSGVDLVQNFCATAPSLKWIHVLNAGVDKIATPEVLRRDLKISNTRDVHGEPTSEYVMTFILCFLKSFHYLFRYQSRRQWVWYAGRKRELAQGKTVGILGLGSIGTSIARKCREFGMRVVATKRRPIDSEWVEHVYPATELESLLRESDFVVCIVPLSQATEKLMGKKEFKQMKKSAYFINVGRGKTVDEEALVEALRDGEIAGAGLDAFVTEPLPEDSPLWDMDNVIISPHTSADAVGYIDKAVGIFRNHLKLFMKDEPLPYEVDKTWGY